jgi:hypothetical protein
MEHIQVLKDLLEVAIEGDDDGKKPDLFPKEIDALQWAIEQLEKNYEGKGVLPMKKHVYFISYVDSGAQGMTEFKTDNPIETYDDVVRVAETIENHNGSKNVVIENWKELKTEKSKE